MRSKNNVVVNCSGGEVVRLERHLVSIVVNSSGVREGDALLQHATALIKPHGHKTAPVQPPLRET
ncbi:hypothetical protein TcasGA2_TC013287 [Tribolium castaneum]|uniref:Uncharacterized protein n=1 Tax=Tribolium castaneum TaxID=7070 RepID=D6WP37_TRICA|nr:hypothetical protein TcasGA2_TC013287 [Tribolium castaneum]